MGALWLNSAETYVDVWNSRDFSDQEKGGADEGKGYLSRLAGEVGGSLSQRFEKENDVL